MVNKHFYQEVLARVRDAVRRRRPELWENQTWMLHHDNAPAHALQRVSQELDWNRIDICRVTKGAHMEQL
jgi:hypothetical protein